MGYVFDFKDARAYAQWASGQCNQWATTVEQQLMLKLLKPASGESVLHIGCGTGLSTLPLLELGLNVTGLDPSPYMLDLSHATLGHRVDLYRGYAEDLPFDDNSFNHAFFFITLEFVEDAAQAIAEACRVAKDKVFIGFLNRYALKGIQRRLEGLFTTTIYNRARFFGIWEIKRLIRQSVGPVPIEWRTVGQLPLTSTRVLQAIEQSDFVQRGPFGAFAGMVATLVPRFRTRPLAMRYKPKESNPVFSGSVPARPTLPQPGARWSEKSAGRDDGTFAARSFREEGP